MGVEHVHAGEFVAELEYAALGLGLHDGVGEFGGRQAGAGGVVVEKVGMQMEGVDQVELQDVDQVNAHGLVYFELDGMVLIMEGDAVDGVEIVLIVKVDIQTMHDHDHFVIDRRAATFGIDDERAVQTFGDMARQRENMTMIQMQAERLGVELVDE